MKRKELFDLLVNESKIKKWSSFFGKESLEYVKRIGVHVMEVAILKKIWLICRKRESRLKSRYGDYLNLEVITKGIYKINFEGKILHKC